jgi:hypothetical protein
MYRRVITMFINSLRGCLDATTRDLKPGSDLTSFDNTKTRSYKYRVLMIEMTVEVIHISRCYVIKWNRITAQCQRFSGYDRRTGAFGLNL